MKVYWRETCDHYAESKYYWAWLLQAIGGKHNGKKVILINSHTEICKINDHNETITCNFSLQHQDPQSGGEDIMIELKDVKIHPRYYVFIIHRVHVAMRTETDICLQVIIAFFRVLQQ